MILLKYADADPPTAASVTTSSSIVLLLSALLRALTHICRWCVRCTHLAHRFVAFRPAIDSDMCWVSVWCMDGFTFIVCAWSALQMNEATYTHYDPTKTTRCLWKFIWGVDSYIRTWEMARDRPVCRPTQTHTQSEISRWIDLTNCESQLHVACKSSSSRLQGQPNIVLCVYVCATPVIYVQSYFNLASAWCGAYSYRAIRPGWVGTRSRRISTFAQHRSIRPSAISEEDAQQAVNFQSIDVSVSVCVWFAVAFVPFVSAMR